MSDQENNFCLQRNIGSLLRMMLASDKYKAIQVTHHKDLKFFVYFDFTEIRMFTAVLFIIVKN